MIPAAFYAPMKSPDDPVPSGDRTMARALLKALTHAGYTPELASQFRSREPKGDTHTQQKQLLEAKIEIRKILDSSEAKKWQFWLTYHNYYKAPDLLGPSISRALNIPYLLVEATRARKRLGGPWDVYARSAEAASEAADAIFYFTHHDAEALMAYAGEGQKLVRLPPFLPMEKLPPASPCPPKLISVGMFRSGDKLASYQLIAETLRLLKHPDWRLEIVGDGSQRHQIETLMRPFGDKVSLPGALHGRDLQKAFNDAGILFWPGVNEAFGMAYIEAQASGLVVVAQDRPGVRDVLAPGVSRPHIDAGPQALATQIDALLTNDNLRAKASSSARSFIAKSHLIGTASDTLKQTINGFLP